MSVVRARDKLDYAIDLLRTIHYALLLEDVAMFNDSPKSIATTLSMALELVEVAQHELE